MCDGVGDSRWMVVSVGGGDRQAVCVFELIGQGFFCLSLSLSLDRSRSKEKIKKK